MTSATRSRADSLVPADPAGMEFLQTTKLLIEKANQNLKIKMKEELDVVTKEKTASREDVRMPIKVFIDRLFATKTKIDHLERFRAPSRSDLEITKGSPNTQVLFGIMSSN